MESLLALWALILQWIEKIFPKAAGAQVSLGGWLELIRQIAALLPLPSVDDKEGCRAWLAKLETVAEGWAAKTSITLDDDACKLWKKALADDEVYDLLWGRWQKLIHSNLVGAESDADQEAHIALLADKAAIDPATIALIIQAVLAVLDWWKNRKQTTAAATPVTEAESCAPRGSF